jgi:hypothetical protein
MRAPSGHEHGTAAPAVTLLELERTVEQLSAARKAMLYERDPSVPGGMRLTGLSYLLVAPVGDDGQPSAAPFAKGAGALAQAQQRLCLAAQERDREPRRGSVHRKGWTLHRGDELDGARVDLEGKPERRVQPDQSAREVGTAGAVSADGVSRSN